MSERLKCECGFDLPSATHFCLNCGRKHAIACGVFTSISKLYVFFVGVIKNDLLAFKRYSEQESINNLYEVAAEKIHERRVEEIFISAESDQLMSEAFEHFKRSLYPFKLVLTDVFPAHEEFFSRLEEHVRTIRELRRVEIPAHDKVHGSHSTIIGGRQGYSLVLKLASSPYVKKVVPGVIESSGIAAGGGVRLKVTRCDEKGNIKALLIDGATVQQIFVITTASDKREGEIILRELKKMIEDV